MGSILLWSTLKDATLIGSTYYLRATLLGLTLQGATKLKLAEAKLAGDNLVDGNITLLASDVTFFVHCYNTLRTRVDWNC